jgi:hypothetical protein
MLAQFTLYLIASLSAAILATALAHAKHRTWMLWGIMSMFFPPVVLILLFLPARSGPAPYEQEYRDEYDEDIGDEYDDAKRDRGGFFW